MSPLVSIITPCFNSGGYLEATIDSVIAQTYGTWELLLIDDGSTDNTRSIMKRYSELDDRIKCILNPENLGFLRLGNRGIEQSQGELIAFLDSDDLWEPQKLQLQISVLKNESANFIISNYKLMTEEGAELKTFQCPEDISINTLLKGSFIGCLTVLTTKSLIGKTRFRKTFHEDYLMWIDLLSKVEAKASAVREPLAKYRVRRNSVSANKLKCARHQWGIYRTQLNFGVFQSSRLFLNYVFRGVFKHHL